MAEKEEVTIREKSVDSRTVVEVKGKYIVLSEIKSRIESLFTTSAIEEIRIFAGISLRVDTNLSRDVWHGRNLVVLADEINVGTKVTWDVSGKDNGHTYASNAGTGADGPGKDGSDGFPGESGGNVLVQANAIQNPEWLTIISNGGNGSDGQDGGNGRAGTDGRGISREEFREKFPPTAKFLKDSRKPLVKRTANNIESLASHIETQWLVEYPFPLYSVTHTENVLNFNFGQTRYFEGMYVKASTHDGGEITFSHQEGTLLYNCQSFLLYKGTSGQRGQPGGAYGLGGEGGYAGEILAKRLGDGRPLDIKTCCKRGNDGTNGKGGVYGAHGKNGWDMGYLDYSMDSQIFYGQDEKSKLELVFDDQNAWNRVYCPYKALNSRYVFAGIRESRIDHQSRNAFEERNNKRTSDERQHHSKAVGQKFVPRMRIVATFSEYLEEIERERQVLERQRNAKIKQERQRIEEEKQRIQRKKHELEMQRIKKEEQERQRIEKEHQEKLKELERQRIEKEKQIEDEQQEKQRIQREKQELERQRIETEQLEKHRIEKEKQQLEKQRLEKERQELEKQRIEKEKQELKKQQIEEEKQQIEKEKLALEKHRIEQEKLTDYLEYDALQQDVENLYTERNRTTDLDIKRFINFSQDTTGQNQYEFIKLDKLNQDSRKEEIFTTLRNNVDLDDWLQLQSRIIELPELLRLVEHFETLKPQFDHLFDRDSSDKINAIVETLKIKYKFSILTKIAQKLPIYHEKVGKVILTAQKATRYLEETEEQDDSIYHPALGTLRQYIFENSAEQRDKITKFVATNSENSFNALKHSIEVYTLGIDETKIENERVKHFYDEYHEFIKHQQNKIDTITETLATELKKPKHEEALRLWNESVDDDVLVEDLEYKLRQDRVLSSLYDQLTREENAEYDWGTCSADEQMQEIFKTNLKLEGILSMSYRVLLAYLYDVSIRVYTRDEDNELVLLEDHNPKSVTTTHILLKANEFIQLRVNEAHRQLEEERVHKDKIYRSILTEVSTMKNIQDIEHYFEQELFNKKSYSYGEKSEEFNEEITIGKIAAFFPADEDQLISLRLKSISPQHTDQHRIFENLLERFSFEGRHVTFNELCFLINSILAHTIDERRERYAFCWIISAYNQCDWTDELVLLKLENCLKRKLHNKAEWRNYMLNIHNKCVLLVFAAQLAQNPCSAESVEDILHLLSNVPIESVCLDQLELSEWPYVLKESFWTNKLQSLITWSNESEILTSATFFILSIENTYGDKIMKTLFEILESKREELTDDVLLHILSSFHSEKWSLCMDGINDLKQNNLKTWIEHMEQKFKINLEELDITQLVTIIKGNANTSTNVKTHMDFIEHSVTRIKGNKSFDNEKALSYFSAAEIEKWAKSLQNILFKPNHTYEQILAVIDRAVELKRGFRLRDTQRLTVLALLANKNKTLAQVSTGEGKSLIVVATAVIKGLLGEKVDIITSSSVLAERDARENKDIYELFGLSASHNCSENMEDRKDAYSCNQIMYGDLTNFQRDYLLDRFYGKHVLGDRNFENVIIDEVDSMLLDKGNNILYLSHDIAGMDKLESVYVFIWQMVNTPTDLPEDVYLKAIKLSVVDDMYPSLQKEDITSLDKAMGKSCLLGIWEKLVESRIMSDLGRLLTHHIDLKKLEEALSPDFTQYKDRLSFLIETCIERERFVKVPNFLKSFVERHLDSWISSARTALCMVPGQYYVVDVHRSGTSADRHANVIILDRDTGTDQVSSQWDEALHQFLQLKHGCKLSTQNLKAVFISNVSFLKMYKLLYGLTGTLGSQRERHLLEKIHQVDFVTIPTAKTKQFEEYEPIICSSKEDWKQQIRKEVNKLTKTNKRSILIICETINDVEALQSVLDSVEYPNVHTYVRNYKKFYFSEGDKMLETGQIIIATNLAGRGTDIKISEELEQAGGLHVILTYLPANIRIEEQAFGRAARKGEKGSGRMIIMVEDGKTPHRSLIFKLKQKRNVDELFRISAIKSYFETTIKTEEDCFKTFNEVYGKKLKCLADADTPDPVKEILLQSCLDKWSFWLDENNELIARSSDETTKRQVKLLLDEFIAQFDGLEATDANSWPAWVEGNPIQMIKLGKYLAQHKLKFCEVAFRLFENVIKNEPHFCEATYYYRAYTRSLNNMNIGSFKCDLRMAERLLEEHVKSTIHASGVVGKLKARSPQIDGYQEQKKSLINLYSLFVQSIDDMLGHAITPESFVNYDIKEDAAGKIFEDLVQIGMIKKAKVVGNISNLQLQKLHSEYGISKEQLKEFLTSHIGTIDENEFLGAIRSSFSFSSRRGFWDTLVKQNVLHSVEEYVTINQERLKLIECAVSNVIKEKVEKRELVNEVIKLEKNQILLIHEHHLVVYFEKKKLINAIGENKFNYIEEKGLLSFNQRATIDKSKMTDCVFSTFDSITAEDITNKTRITPSEANIIIDELLKQQVLEKRSDSFALSFNYEQDFLLSTFPVYENVIRSVLASCFAYKLALRNIARQLEDEDCSVIRIELKPDPHRMFFNDLLEQKIIQPPMATHEIDESKLKILYISLWSKEVLERVLAKHIGLSEPYTKLLVDVLIENRWLVPDAFTEALSNPFVQQIMHVKGPQLLLRLTSNNDRSSLVELKKGIASINEKHGLVETYDVGVAVEQWFNNQSILTQSETAKHIENVLNKSKSSLAALDIPKGELKSIMEFYGKGNFGNIDEMRIFITNGLEHLLQLAEKKWSVKMILKTTAVLCIGLAQIAIGAIMEVYSAGMMTHVAGGLIGEGVSDIMFAVGAFKSGYFSWQDYGSQKLQSLLFTISTAGVAMYMSQGAKVSRIGYKVAGPSLEYTGKRVAETAGEQLTKAVSGVTVVKETAKRMALKTAEGVSFAVANATVDTIVTDHLQSMLNSLASDILLGVKKEVTNHNVVHNLKKAYDLLDERDAKALVNDLTNAYLMEQNTTHAFLPFAKQISQSVMQGIGKANQKTGTTSSTMALIHQLSRAMDLVDRLGQINKMCNATQNLLESINCEMERKLTNIEQNSVSPKEDQPREKDFDRFQREVIEQWEAKLSEHVGKLLAQHVVLPVMKMGVNSALVYVGKALQDIGRSMIESELKRDVNRLKDDHKQKMKQSDMTAETKRQLTEVYHSQLLKIMRKTRSPTLFASIIRENVPMDLTCVGVCTPIIHKMLQAQNDSLSGLTITVHGENGIKQSFNSGEGGPEIHLVLVDNHFTLVGARGSAVDTSRNNCLYGALATAIPELQTIGEDGFRTKLSDSIQHDASMHHHIRQGWHRIPLKHGAVGGARKPCKNTKNAKQDVTFKMPKAILPKEKVKTGAKKPQTKKLIRTDECDDESSTIDGQPIMEDSRTPAYHLDSRLAHHTVRVAGELKKISEIMKISVEDLIQTGRSMFKAARSCSEKDHHQAHVVRVSFTELLEVLKADHPELYRKLTNHVGHTQLVDKFVNVFHDIGGDIDKNQVDWILQLATVDYSKQFDSQSRNVFESYKSSVLRMFDSNINSNKYTKEQVLVLKNARNIMYNTTTAVLFERAQRGYDLKYEYKSAGRDTKRSKIHRTNNEE